MRNIKNSWEQYLDIIESLQETTKDYLFLLDIKAGLIWFPGEISQKYKLPVRDKNQYMVKELESLIYSRDWCAMKKEWGKIRSGASTKCNIECHLMDRNGDKVWASIQGKSRLGEDRRPEIMLGRISDTVINHKRDAVTGLLNSECFYRDMELCIKRGEKGYLLVLGVDELQAINMQHGRGYGNYILKTITTAMEESVDPAFGIYRLDGDRYAVNLEHQAKEAVERLYSEVQKKLSSRCTVSAGAVSYGEEIIEEAGTLYQYAEIALSRAKWAGKNKLIFFSAEDYEKRMDMIELREELGKSIREGFSGFSLYYQPQIRQSNYQIFGAEALLRYHSVERGDISPEKFISILEQTGMIIPVGEWVLRTALAQCKKWREKLPDFHISVNVSYVQMRNKGIMGMVLDLLQKAELPGDCLTLEMTESMQLQDYRYFNRIFYTWRKHGIEISIDDFGTGYSSLGYLKSLEINEIKIDRCFVNRIQHSAYNYRLLSNIIELAHSAQLRVCCEGVETKEELAVLKRVEPELYQGYLFGKPYNAEEFRKLYVEETNVLYQEREETKKKLREFCCSEKKDENQEGQEGDHLEVIVESMDEVVYISDPYSYDLYYLNSAGRILTGLHDYKGMKCYKVLQGRNDPCEFCTNHKLNYDSFYVWERDNVFLGRYFLLKDKLISWEGKKARLEIAVDVTEKEYVSRKIQAKLDFEKNIVSCIKMLVEEPDMPAGIMKVLQAVGEFYKADRCYIFKPSGDRATWDNIYEWNAQGVIPQKDKLQNVPVSIIQRWIEAFHRGESVIILNLDQIKREWPQEWKILSDQGIRRLLVTPIRKGQTLIGFIGVDNPRYCHGDAAQLCAVAYFLADRTQRGIYI